MSESMLPRDPDLFDLLRANRDLIPAAIDENLRWGNPVQWARTGLTPYEVDGTEIPAQARVALFFAGANRDPERHKDQDTFGVYRRRRAIWALGRARACASVPDPRA
ncbi:hypothetical protein [Mycobacterium sp. E2479]|uniref:hypothetical protein n=1 Tax=Mycobacterium sp. E2479 TaxID=1834134 RepID=UPI000A985C96|nr:hypothetical protein [Mycobacterium sp. E2479]